MPYKYLEQKGVKIPKQKHKVSNWSEYNEELKISAEFERQKQEAMIGYSQ